MEEEKTNSVFERLSKIDVNNHTEKKNGLTYLSWAWAWTEFKNNCPDATYKIKRFGEKSLPYVYDVKTGYMVFTSVTVGKETQEMFLPVMDGANKVMKKEDYEYTNRYKDVKTCKAATMFDINKTIMRCLVKNLAMFGLGLYIYAGEDLPEKTDKQIENEKQIEEFNTLALLKGEIASRIKEIKPDLEISKYREYIKEKTGEVYNEKSTEKTIRTIIQKLEVLLAEKKEANSKLV